LLKYRECHTARLVQCDAILNGMSIWLVSLGNQSRRWHITQLSTNAWFRHYDGSNRTLY